jgi:hypothetical protein
MKPSKPKKNTSSGSPRERMPLHTRRSGIIWQRAQHVFWEVGSLLDEPFTRTAFKNHIESILTEAASAFCQYVYAVANSKRAHAARYWEQVQGIVEYELPMGLLHPVKNLKKRNTREKAVEEVTSIIAAEMARHNKVAEERYTKLGREESDKNSCERKAFHLTKPLVRPTNSQFQEFFSWANEVMRVTLNFEERMTPTLRQVDKELLDDSHGVEPIENRRKKTHGKEETHTHEGR